MPTISQEAAIIAGSPSICPLHCLTEFGAATNRDTSVLCRGSKLGQLFAKFVSTAKLRTELGRFALRKGNMWRMGIACDYVLDIRVCASHYFGEENRD